MAVLSHVFGFPRIGLNRELKKALESYWAGEINQQGLIKVGRDLRFLHWKQQKDSGIDLLPVGDFAWYDHVLNTSMMVNNISDKHRCYFNTENRVQLNGIDTLFRVARGCYSDGESVEASDMKKWFNTNYHYIVPEFVCDQVFQLKWCELFDEIDEALSLGYKVKAVILGPLSYLWLGKIKGAQFDRLSLLPSLLQVYRQILNKLAMKGIDWVQIDEPILVLEELPYEWLSAYQNVYYQLRGVINILLATYFGSISHQLKFISSIPVQGIHVDLVSGDDSIDVLHNLLPHNWIISVGVINGRNVWRTDLKYWFKVLYPFVKNRDLWVSTSCSLLHIPVDINAEKYLDEEMKGWFSFAIQKCFELNVLCRSLNAGNVEAHLNLFSDYNNFKRSSLFSKFVYDNNVRIRVKEIEKLKIDRLNTYNIRLQHQQNRFNFPVLPTTTIGSFPQTSDIRHIRRDFKNGVIDEMVYKTTIKQYIKRSIREQEQLGLDVLVHGEPERNDMVEYFAEHLNGFIITNNGWVQSYGSRCVKPPIIVGDVSRSKDITVEWIGYAQSLTDKPVKGILTGPVTIFCWSFPREDLDNKSIVFQIALAIRDEVKSLEESGIGIIQIDEPALREGLPLKCSSWSSYLEWAVDAFKISSSVVNDSTQIHSHMCYSEFHDIIDSILALDADVISIESSRSGMSLLKLFNEINCVNSLGLGVYDVHSPNIPEEQVIFERINRIVKHISYHRVWINPDCGLKTRTWSEIYSSLKNMVSAVKKFRQTI